MAYVWGCQSTACSVFYPGIYAGANAVPQSASRLGFSGCLLLPLLQYSHLCCRGCWLLDHYLVDEFSSETEFVPFFSLLRSRVLDVVRTISMLAPNDVGYTISPPMSPNVPPSDGFCYSPSSPHGTAWDAFRPLSSLQKLSASSWGSSHLLTTWARMGLCFPTRSCCTNGYAVPLVRTHCLADSGVCLFVCRSN